MGDSRTSMSRVDPDYGSLGESDSKHLLQSRSDEREMTTMPPSEHPVYRAGACSPFRLVILFCIMCLTFGSYWVFDTPGSIPDQLNDYFEEEGKSINDAQNLAFYSVYSWPNTLLALFGGVILDKVTGLRAGTVIFSAFILLGQGMFALGISLRVYWIALLGRFVFGLGGESLTVAQNSFTVKWFEGKYLAMAFGSVVSFARIGSSVNFKVTPTLAKVGVPFSLWFGFGACALSFIVSLLLSSLDKFAELRRPWLTKPIVPDNKSISVTDIIKQIRMIPFTAWILFFICMFFYVGVLTFNTVASKILKNTGHKYSKETASSFLAIPNLVSVFASPLFGLLVDRVGRAMTWVCIASGMMIVSMVMFLSYAYGWIHINPAILMVWQGTGYALGAAAIWPSLSYVVAPEVCSTAYGMMTSVQNLGMAVFPLIIGFVQRQASIKFTLLKYTIPIILFIACEIISLCLSLFLLVFDKRLTGGRLNATHAQRVQLEKAQNPEKPKTGDLEATQAQAKSRIDQLKRANEEQHLLLVRDAATNRSGYYSKLGVGIPTPQRLSITHRPAFM
eukprot:c25205_g1_i1.p1 GENE.c25205_g1_i1~~c25205_g1_i1.p1  ORF type:complete len:562 (+),score=114.87 c25205_g1_i1:1-1686(+)